MKTRIIVLLVIPLLLIACTKDDVNFDAPHVENIQPTENDYSNVNELYAYTLVVQLDSLENRLAFLNETSKTNKTSHKNGFRKTTAAIKNTKAQLGTIVNIDLVALRRRGPIGPLGPGPGVIDYLKDVSKPSTDNTTVTLTNEKGIKIASVAYNATTQKTVETQYTKIGLDKGETITLSISTMNNLGKVAHAKVKLTVR